MVVEDIAAIPWGRGREPSNAEHIGVSGVVDQPLGAVVSADELHSPSPLSVARVFAWRAHTARQVQLHQIGAKGSSRPSHQQHHWLLLRNRLWLFRRRRRHTTCSNSLWSRVDCLFRCAELCMKALLAHMPGRCPGLPCGNFFGVFHLRHKWGWCRGCRSLHRHYVLHPLHRLWCRLNFALHLIDTKSRQFHGLFWEHLAVQMGSVAVWLVPQLAGQVSFQTCDRARM